ncbi:hypothetical protein JCM3766R1_001152 [Sporobolomyces carnicolor]
MIGASSASPFPGPPVQRAAADPGDQVRRGSLRDITTVSFGNPNSLPGPAPSHFFPSVPKLQRDQQRAARLSSPPRLPPLSVSAQASHSDADRTYGERHRIAASPREASALSSPSSNATSHEDDIELEQRQRAANFERSNPGSLREDSSTSATPTLKSVGGGGSHGTKRRHRETAERTNWDAASELVRIERERETVIDRWGTDSSRGAVGRMAENVGEPTRRRDASIRGQKIGSPSLTGAPRANDGRNRTSVAGSVADSQAASPADVEMEDAEGDGEDFEEEDDLDDDDGASVATFKTGASTKSKGKSKAASGEKEPAKKRSRTLTTPAQTAVLNALLAKTRFPSTETREEVGAQIGMSARRVQIWFQNRRQSQKRLRDREVQDSVISSMPTNASNHSLPLGHGIPVHPHYPYGPPTSDPYAAHRYPHATQGAPHTQQQRFSGVSVSGSFQSPAAASSQVSVHHVQQHRQDLSRQTSVDSLASRASFVSAASGAVPAHSGGGVLREETHVNPYSSAPPYFRQSQAGPSPTTHQPHSSTTRQHQAPSTFPSKLYFPHVSRSEHSAAPSTRIRTESTNSAAGDIKLPSLSSLLNGPSGPPTRQQVPPSHNFSAATSQPSTAASSGAPVFNRAIFSPPPSSSFERLRISNAPQSPPPQSEQIPTTSTSPFAFHPPPLQPQASRPPSQTMSPVRETSPDVLDVAMEAMAYRPAGRSLPPRSTLPPLRSVFPESTFPSKPRGGGKTEADKALMAPISVYGPTSLTSPFNASVSPQPGPPRLPPISNFPLNLSPSASPAPPLHAAPSPHNRSSMTPSFDSATRQQVQQSGARDQTSAGWLAFNQHKMGIASSTGGSSGSTSYGSGSHESPRHRSSVGSSSRTSVSSGDRHEK